MTTLPSTPITTDATTDRGTATTAPGTTAAKRRGPRTGSLRHPVTARASSDLLTRPAR